MTRLKTALGAATTLLLLAAAPVQAHLLKAFAYAEGDSIHGRVYFSGGNPAAGARVSVIGADGTTLAQLQTDAAGEFIYIARNGGDHRLRADSGDGHVAEWTVRAAELDARLATNAGANRPQQASGTAPARADSDAAPVLDAATLALIERAVARQLGPLRLEIQSYADRVRLSDLLGGIGCIVGLAGVGLWWRDRRRGHHRHD